MTELEAALEKIDYLVATAPAVLTAERKKKLDETIKMARSLVANKLYAVEKTAGLKEAHSIRAYVNQKPEKSEPEQTSLF